MLNFKMYIVDVLKTESNDFSKIGQNMSSQRNIRLLHATMGISTEITELFEMIQSKNLDLTNLMEECGDATWYIGIAVNELGVDADSFFEKAKSLSLKNKNSLLEKSLMSLDFMKRKKIQKLLNKIVKSSGNSLDLMKKGVFYSREINLEKMEHFLIEILADLISILKVGDFDIEETFQININKLHKKRFKSGQFSSQEANNRNLEEERKTLESKGE